MPSTQDIVVGKKFYSLYKGIPGTGKSIAAHSHHVLGPTYTFDFDRKMGAVASHYPKANIEYDTFSDVFLALNKLAALRKNCPYKNIIWDGWSSFAKLSLQSVLEVRAPGKKRVMKGNIETYQVEDYNAESRAVQQALDDLKGIYEEQGVNVITVSHIIHVEVYEITTGRTRIHEGLFIPGGKIAFEVPVGFDEQYAFTVESSIVDGSTGNFMCTTTGSNGCKTILKVPGKFNWTKKNFYQTLMEYHEKGSKVIAL